MRQPPLKINFAFLAMCISNDRGWSKTQFNRSVRRLIQEYQKDDAALSRHPNFRSRKRKNRRMMKLWRKDVRKHNAKLQGDSYYLELPNMELVYEHTTT